MKSFFIFLFFCFSTTSKCQKLHAFLLCNTNDPTIKDAVRVNYHNFDDLTNQIAEALNYELKSHTLIGNEFKQEKVKGIIELADIGPLDIVIIYISSHGAKREIDKDNFPIVSVPDAFVSSFGIYRDLAKKNPKALIEIVEACSGYKKVDDKQIAFLYRQSIPFTPLSFSLEGVKKNNIIQLFSNKCRFIVCAGQPGLDTWATDRGSIFSNSFLKSFNEFISQNQFISWKKILEKSRDYTFDETRVTRLPHYPVWSNPKCDLLISQSIDEDSTDIVNMQPSTIAKLNISVSGPHRKSLFSKKRYYDFILQLENSAGVDSVTYFLHHTFKDSIVTRYRNNASDRFRYKLINVWGEFPIKATIHYKNNVKETVYDEIKFPDGSGNHQKLVSEIPSKILKSRKFSIELHTDLVLGPTNQNPPR